VKVIAVGSPKGGVGKSTTVLYLATAAAQRGLRVAIIDRDESRHLTELLRRRKGLLCNGVALLEGDDVPKDGYDIVFIDTPPGVTAIRALHEADLVIVPVPPEEQGVVNLPRYLRNVEAQRRGGAHGLRLVAIQPTMVKPRRLHRHLLQTIVAIAARHDPPLLVLTPVPDRARIAEYDLSAPDYAPSAQELFAHVQLA
jgi:cellulose biosynthesis protein BcsQ